MEKLEIEAVASKTHTKVHIALDFDGTLADYDTWDIQRNKVGKPIARMVKQVKKWLDKGYEISIFTARLSHSQIESAENIVLIQKFLTDNGLPIFPITCMKMYYFTHFVDDKAWHVEKNTGVITEPINFNLK